jgi:hypothetical protein
MSAKTKQTPPANSANNCALDNSLIAGLSKALNPLNAVDEVIDMFKETASAARNLFKKPDDPELQFEFALCVVGWIPGPGMGLKFAFKQMLKNLIYSYRLLPR